MLNFFHFLFVGQSFAFSLLISLPYAKKVWICKSQNESLLTNNFFVRQKLFGRHAIDSRWVFEWNACRTTWFGSGTNSRCCYWWIWFLESERAKGGRQVTQRQANKATRAYLRVHHDRKTSLPDTSSHAEDFRGKSTASFQYLEPGTNVSASTRLDWVAHQVRFFESPKIARIITFSNFTSFLKKLRLKQRENHIIDSIADILVEFFSALSSQRLKSAYGESYIV